jgi:hypothetical protein
MALVVKDRVKETTTTTGTGTVTLAGAVAGFQAFSVIGNGNTTYYAIVGTTEWEVGIGTYSSTGPTLARTLVMASSNSGSLVNFSAGAKDVFVTSPAGAAVLGGGNGGTGPAPLIFNSQVVSQNVTVDTGLNAQSVGPITINSGISVTVNSGQRWLVV